MGLMHLRKTEQQQQQQQQLTQNSGGLTHHDITTPTLSSLSKQTKMYNNTLISSNNNNLMASITESKIPIVRDDGKSSSRLNHHLHHMTLRGRSKVRVRTSAGVEQSTAARILRDSSTTPTCTYHHTKTTTVDTNSNPITTDKSNDDLTKTGGITLELNATTIGGTHPSGIPINNNNIKRGKRSLSSTRIEKDKCDEYNTKLLRKTANATNNNSTHSTTTTNSSGSSASSSTNHAGSTTTSSSSSTTATTTSSSTMTKSSSLSRKLGSSSLTNDSSTLNTAQTNTCSRISKCPEQSLSLKLRKKISY